MPATTGRGKLKELIPSRLPNPSADFAVENHGTIFLLRPITPAAFEWVQERLPEDRQEFGDAVVVEHRYIADIVRGILNDGLAVRP